MLKINLICIGKVKEKYFTDAFNEYVKRLGAFCSFNLIELDECLLSGSVNESTVKKRESEALFKKAKGYVVLMDIGGKNLSSEEFAQKLSDLSVSGKSEISFLIGGSLGVDEEYKPKADYKLSFGKNTFPHQMVRVMFVEQLYRACCINNNKPYHK